MSPGIKSDLDLMILSPIERKIVRCFSEKYWYITRCERVALKSSEYYVVLMKPTEYVSQNFNLHREVRVVFSRYSVFEARTLSVLDMEQDEKVRVEEICSVIISKDDRILEKIVQYEKRNAESRILVPFSYSDFDEKLEDDEFVLNRIREKFYTRDLFGIQVPLQNDLFFFGRKDLVNDLVNKHLTADNAGIFGLRKTGKTSILNSVRRTLDRKSSVSVIIDCETLHNKSWNQALFHILIRVREECENVKRTDIHAEEDFADDSKAADYFSEDIKRVYSKNGRKSILLIFDEIEHITFETSISESWKSGEAFIKFWQAVRSAYQQHARQGIFTYLLAGTNPRCVEQASIQAVDNPLFEQFTPQYIGPFTYDNTREMVEKLGGYMGIILSPEVITHLVEDFGGHPLLMRQMCSYIHRNSVKQRPLHIDKITYEDMRQHFYAEESGFNQYAEMILSVLSNWYPDEYTMLEWLAVGDEELFHGMAASSSQYITHLLRYGILYGTGEKYAFKIEALQDYFSRKHKYTRLHLTNEEKLKEIGERRTKVEIKLRKLVRMQLKATFGEDNARRKVVMELYKNLSKDTDVYKNYFDANHHKIFLSNLIHLISDNYEKTFRNIFHDDCETFQSKMAMIAIGRNADAHAKDIDDNEFNLFRGAVGWLENILEDYLG